MKVTLTLALDTVGYCVSINRLCEKELPLSAALTADVTHAGSLDLLTGERLQPDPSSSYGPGTFSVFLCGLEDYGTIVFFFFF